MELHVTTAQTPIFTLLPGALAANPDLEIDPWHSSLKGLGFVVEGLGLWVVVRGL